jgi:hypothetical protein
VLIVGDNPTAETYNYVTGMFSPAGSEGAFQRSFHTATLLANGDVLIAGGVDLNGNPLISASVYNPSTGTFTPTANNMSVAHIQGFAARLSDGRVLVGGGYSGGTNPTDNVDIYDPATNMWSLGAPLPPPPFQAVSSEAESMSDGDVILLGAGQSGNQTLIYAPGILGPTVSPPAENCSGLTSGGGGGGGGTGDGGGTGGGGGGGTGTGTGTGSGSGTPTPTPRTPTPITVKVVSVTANSSGRIKIRISTTGAATVAAIATTPAQTKVKGSRNKRWSLRYGRASATVGRAETITVTITPSGPARSLLTKGKNLRVTIVLTFRPAGAVRSVKTVTLKVHGHKPKKRSG